MSAANMFLALRSFFTLRRTMAVTSTPPTRGTAGTEKSAVRFLRFTSGPPTGDTWQPNAHEGKATASYVCKGCGSQFRIPSHQIGFDGFVKGRVTCPLSKGGHCTVESTEIVLLGWTAFLLSAVNSTPSQGRPAATPGVSSAPSNRTKGTPSTPMTAATKLSSDTKPVYLPTSEVAQYTGYQPRTIREWCKDKRLTAAKCSHGRWMIHCDDHVCSLIKANLVRLTGRTTVTKEEFVKLFFQGSRAV